MSNDIQHYSLTYEENEKRYRKKLKSQLRSFVTNSKVSDLEFVMDVVNNLEDWKAVMRVIGNK